MLEELTLSSLERTRAGEQFEEAMKAIRESLEKDGDIQKARTVSIEISFKPDPRGFLSTELSVNAKTPKRSISTISTYEDGSIKIDTFTNDARQPALPGMENDTVIPFQQKGESANGDR